MIKKRFIKTFLPLLLFISIISVKADDSTIVNSYDIINYATSSTAPATIVVLTGKEKLKTPYDSLMDDISFVPLNRISEPMFFKEGLFITEYKKLIAKRFKRDYPDAFKNTVINDFFFNALSEYVYSNNGRLDPDFCNKIENGRKMYFEIRPVIMKLKAYHLVKLGLQYITLKAFVYEHTLKSVKIAVEKLEKIPDYPLLYIVNPPDFLKPKSTSVENKDENGDIQSVSFARPTLGDKDNSKDSDVNYGTEVDEFGNKLYGNYINFGMGENLYYICASIYPEFVNLPGDIQLKVLDFIYDFNINVTTSRAIRADNTLWSYLKEQISGENTDIFLKYRLSTVNSWLLLPQNLKSFKSKAN